MLHSHKQAVTYLEYTRIVKSDEKVGYLKEGKGVELTFALPYGNTAVLLLGPGTSITQAAMHHLCSEGVLVGFTGGDGFPIFCGSLSEYRAPEYSREWVIGWHQSKAWVLATARQFQRKRVEIVNQNWAKYGLSVDCLRKAETAGLVLNEYNELATSKEELLGYEAQYAKSLYKSLAHEFNVSFTREPRQNIDKTNDLIDAHNYYAYGVAGASLWVLGIPFSFPVLHGQTRRGALVFDVADIIKDGILLPLAFKSAKDNKSISEHKKICASQLQLKNCMTILLNEIKVAIENQKTFF